MLRRYMVTTCLECRYSRYGRIMGAWCIHGMMLENVETNPVSEKCTKGSHGRTYPEQGCCYFTRRRRRR